MPVGNKEGGLPQVEAKERARRQMFLVGLLLAAGGYAVGRSSTPSPPTVVIQRSASDAMAPQTRGDAKAESAGNRGGASRGPAQRAEDLWNAPATSGHRAADPGTLAVTPEKQRLLSMPAALTVGTVSAAAATAGVAATRRTAAMPHSLATRGYAVAPHTYAPPPLAFESKDSRAVGAAATRGTATTMVPRTRSGEVAVCPDPRWFAKWDRRDHPERYGLPKQMAWGQRILAIQVPLSSVDVGYVGGASVTGAVAWLHLHFGYMLARVDRDVEVLWPFGPGEPVTVVYDTFALQGQVTAPGAVILDSMTDTEGPGSLLQQLRDRLFAVPGTEVKRLGGAREASASRCVASSAAGLRCVTPEPLSARSTFARDSDYALGYDGSTMPDDTATFEAPDPHSHLGGVWCALLGGPVK